MTIEEITTELDKLNERHTELLGLSTEEFLGESVGKELDYIHERSLYLIRLLSRENGS